MPTMRTTTRKRVGNGQLFRRLFGDVPQIGILGRRCVAAGDQPRSNTGMPKHIQLNKWGTQGTYWPIGGEDYLEHNTSILNNVTGCSSATAHSYADLECAQSTPGSNLATPSVLQLAKTRKLSAERSEARRSFWLLSLKSNSAAKETVLSFTSGSGLKHDAHNQELLDGVKRFWCCYGTGLASCKKDMSIGWRKDLPRARNGE
ncbi:hypothetical protein AgCh_031439 [Apium graveolens]